MSLRRSNHRPKILSASEEGVGRVPIPSTRIETTSLMRTFLTCILILICSSLSFAQQAVPVSIVSLSGAKVPDLTNANFLASYKGKAVRVGSASVDNGVRRIVLLLDVSDSMLGKDSEADWNFPLDVAENLLAGMPSSTAIGLSAFGTGLQHVISPTNDRKKVKDELEEVRKARWSFSKPNQADTSIRDSIIAGTKLFDHPQLGDALYIITDGIDNTSEAALDYVYEALACRGIRLFTFIVSARADYRISSGASAGQRTMRDLSEDTGGYSILELLPSGSPDHRRDFVDKSGKPTNLGQALFFQYRAILGVYRLSVDLPEVSHKRQDWRLDLSGLDAPAKNNLVLLYPKKFELCD